MPAASTTGGLIALTDKARAKLRFHRVGIYSALLSAHGTTERIPLKLALCQQVLEAAHVPRQAFKSFGRHCPWLMGGDWESTCG